MQDLLKAAQDYLKEHPEVEELLKRFHISWEQYQRFLATITPPQVQSASTLTNQGSLDVGVSKSAQ